MVVILKNLGQGRGHHGFSQAHHVADQHTATLVEVVCGDLDGGGLEVEQCAVEDGGDAEFRQSGPRLLCEVVGHLEIDVVRLQQALAGPAFVDDGRQLLGDIDAPAVVPAVIEPRGQLVACIVLQHINVEFALLG